MSKVTVVVVAGLVAEIEIDNYQTPALVVVLTSSAAAAAVTVDRNYRNRRC